MSDAIDDHFVAQVRSWADEPRSVLDFADPQGRHLDPSRLLALLEAQVQSRHLDFAARWMHGQGEGFYTIGSAGHESNAAVAAALRVTDPALLHYRSGAFYAARAQQHAGSTPVIDVLASLASSIDDPISHGRHKVFGHPDLSIIPQTSTIGSHLPRAVGLAFMLPRAHQLGADVPWPADSVVVTSFGDASVNHSTTTGALNSASYITHRGLPLPLLMVCEDNGIGISTPTPAGWIEAALSGRPGIEYVPLDGTRPAEALTVLDDVVAGIRATRRPALVHLRTVRFMGHAGSDVESAYRPARQITADRARDPILATAATLVAGGVLRPSDVLGWYEATREFVMAEAKLMCGPRRLESAEEVMSPLTVRRSRSVRLSASASAADERRHEVFRGRLPEHHEPLTLAGAINATLFDLMASRPHLVVFGEDVAVKGGVYGVTRGLYREFGPRRVFDSILDEQTILGTGLGAGLAGLLPIAEIQYLAYLHNAEDQLRGEGASLAFFSDGQFANPMVVRIPGLAYQRGFGGHFHNDDSVAVLRDIPGLIVACPGHPSSASELLRTCVALAEEEGRVCVFLEPIAQYHQRDLTDGDGMWLTHYVEPALDLRREVFGVTASYGDGTDLLLVTFGNGVRLSMEAAMVLEAEGIGCTVLDLRWLAPLPVDDLLEQVEAHRRVLVVDETRRSGGVAESVLAVLADAGFDGTVRRVTSEDSYVPLGPAADHVLLSATDVVVAGRAMVRPGR